MSDDLFFSGEERPETLLYTGTEEREEIISEERKFQVLFGKMLGYSCTYDISYRPHKFWVLSY